MKKSKAVFISILLALSILILDRNHLAYADFDDPLGLNEALKNIFPIDINLCGSFSMISNSGALAVLSIQNEVYAQSNRGNDFSDWVSVSGNQPWGDYFISDLDVSNTGVDYAVLSAGNIIYYTGGSLVVYDANNNNYYVVNNAWGWRALNSATAPWGQTFVNKIAFQPQVGSLEAGIIALVEGFIYYKKLSDTAIFQDGGWQNVKDNRPWGFNTVTDVAISTIQSMIVGYVIAGGRLYHHPDLNDLTNKDWILDQTGSPYLTNLSNLDKDNTATLITTDSTNVFATNDVCANNFYPTNIDSPLNISLVDCNLNQPWGTAPIVDVSIGRDIDGNICIGEYAVLAGDSDLVPYRNDNYKWINAEKNAPWKLPGGPCAP